MSKGHEKIETNVSLMAILIAVAISFGGLAEIVPLMYQAEAIEPLPGVEPYPALELAGRDVYVREGCYNCHSQMIRPLRDEVERYGHYSLAAESMYDHPFQWGSKRTGPDLARVGGKYSDDWHRDHLIDPRSVVPESVMPPYAFLSGRELELDDVQAKLAAMTKVGVPYTQDMIDNARTDLMTQADPFAPARDLKGRYGEAVLQRDFDGDPARLTEMDALIAYMQMLGTLVDFSTYEAEAPENLR